MKDSSAFEFRSNSEHFEAQGQMAHLSAYYSWVLDLFGDGIEFPAADAGAGSGHFASLVRERGGPLVLLEGGVDNLAMLARRFQGDEMVTIVDCDLNDCMEDLRSRDVRSIFSLDVLEHLPDDQAILKQFHAALPVGGRVFIKVPSLPFLFGPVDEASGHYRRYTRATLRKAVESSGFRIDRCHYMNLAAVPAYFLKSRVLRKGENFSKTFSQKSITRIQRAMPWIRRIDRLTQAPIGLSAICVATKA